MRPNSLRLGALTLAIAFGSVGYVFDVLSVLDVHFEATEPHSHDDSAPHQHGDADDHHESPDSDCHHDAHCCCTHAPVPSITESTLAGLSPLAVDHRVPEHLSSSKVFVSVIFRPPIA